MSGNKQSSVETIAAEYVETFLATGMAYEFTAESIAHRSFIDGYTAGSREVGQLKAALALGQENCDAEYDTLREERDEARAELARVTAERDGMKYECNCYHEMCSRLWEVAGDKRDGTCDQIVIAELAALRRDKERLDFCERGGWAMILTHEDETLRDAIDAAMNGGANG